MGFVNGPRKPLAGEAIQVSEQIAAKKADKKARGRVLQVMIDPPLRTKNVLVEASRDTGLVLSSFVLLSAIERAANLRGCRIEDQIPASELESYRTHRFGPKAEAATLANGFGKRG